jgi:outer membrane protein assembly factor BamA
MTKTRLALINAIIAAVAIGSAAPVAAQELPADTGTRAQQAADQRAEKSGRLSPPRRSLIERGLRWYDDNGARLQWRVFSFSGGNLPNGAGLGYGVGIAQKAMNAAVVDPGQPNRIDGELLAARTTLGYQRFAARMDLRNAAALPADVTLSWQDYELTQEDFYGAGINTTTASHSNYRLDGSEYNAGIAWRPLSGVTIGGGAAYLAPLVSPGTDSRYPTTQSRFTEEEAPGISGLPSFARGEAFASFDWRDNETHPRRGGAYKATYSQYRGIDDANYDFARLDVSAQQILPLGNRYRRIELRAGAMMTEARDGANVPFIYQPALGGVSTVRGFNEGRFRDRNAMFARAEYQWEAWWALDAALFVDAGQVAADRSAFTLKEFAVAYGLGFRLHSNSRFLARLDLAYGREGFMPILGFKYGF